MKFSTDTRTLALMTTRMLKKYQRQRVARLKPRWHVATAQIAVAGVVNVLLEEVDLRS
jgi:hypothetical protein